LFASASFGGGCSAGAYQQIAKNMKKKLLRLKLRSQKPAYIFIKL
jgi:hypothetical protein